MEELTQKPEQKNEQPTIKQLFEEIRTEYGNKAFDQVKALFKCFSLGQGDSQILLYSLSIAHIEGDIHILNVENRTVFAIKDSNNEYVYIEAWKVYDEESLNSVNVVTRNIILIAQQIHKQMVSGGDIPLSYLKNTLIKSAESAYIQKNSVERFRVLLNDAIRLKQKKTRQLITELIQ